jgi:hypothetical protein
MVIRAGGWIDRGDGKGWVLDVPDPPAAATVPAPAAVDPAAGSAAGGLPAGADDDPHSPPAVVRQPERAGCPDCGKDVAVNKDGSLRKHTCVLDAPPPQVTFDDGEE